jgi:hypothetical protein
MEERVERRGGRLDLPALFALDELANEVRWAGVPDQFSHYGSKGLIVMGILHSWSQGVELWREANMRKIWSAPNIKVYGGGAAEDGFLRALSDLIGGLQLHQRLRVLRQVRAQPLPPGSQGTHLRYAPSMLGSFLRSFAFGHVRQLDAVASRSLRNLAAQTR